MGPLHSSQHLAPTYLHAGKTTTGRFKAALLG
ncbi:MAG: hypothetical protein JWP21_742, partial [Tardiphaga sp.]|nr:hypothetical protein [Tardiphaga sp.]